jgi:hypothetical protein
MYIESNLALFGLIQITLLILLTLNVLIQFLAFDVLPNQLKICHICGTDCVIACTILYAVGHYSTPYIRMKSCFEELHNYIMCPGIKSMNFSPTTTF